MLNYGAYSIVGIFVGLFFAKIVILMIYYFMGRFAV